MKKLIQDKLELNVLQIRPATWLISNTANASESTWDKTRKEELGLKSYFDMDS